ncbi:MAG: hypothetical protein Q9218_003471 [Villophora microphyllina]
MIIPREDGLVRIYCQLSAVAPGSNGRIDRSRVTPESILDTAQRILRPYKLEYKHRDWWTVYQFADTYNLGWKIAMVVKGMAKPSLLKSYEMERRSVAQELIAFDQSYSRLWSSRPKRILTDQDGISMADFASAFEQQQLFSSGFGVQYGPSILTAKASSNTTDLKCHDAGKPSGCNVDVASSHQDLAAMAVLGQRFPSFKVVNQCDARTWHVANWLKSDGNFHLLLFAGDVSQPSQMDRIRTFARKMAQISEIIPLQRKRPPRKGRDSRVFQDRDGIVRLLTIHSAPRQKVEFHEFPSLLRPYDEELGYDYNCIFVDGDSYYEGHGHAYDGYGIDPTRGCMILIRPDQYVAWIGEVEDVLGLEAYFGRILVERPV